MARAPLDNKECMQACGVRTRACHVETHLDARVLRTETSARGRRRDKSRRGTHECVRHGRRGMTLIELIVATTIMMLLTAMAVPMARSRVRREKERDLLLALREMRNAINQYKDRADKGDFGPLKVGTEGYPETLESLVEGVKIANQVDKKVKFLRRMPLDPMTRTREWGKRSMQDDPKSNAWGGQNVFDVYTNSMDKARDGTPYSEW